MGGLLLSWRLRAFFCCDGLLGEVRRRVLLLLWCRYAADLDRLVWGTSTGLRSGMRGAARLLDVGPCGGGCVVLAGVPFCGVGVTLPCGAARGRACYSIEHLHLAGVPLVPILNAIAQQGARGTARSHSSGREDNLALCAPLALACVDEGGYSLALAHVVTCSATEAAGAASRRARLRSCGCELVLYSMRCERLGAKGSVRSLYLWCDMRGKATCLIGPLQSHWAGSGGNGLRARSGALLAGGDVTGD